MGKSTEKKIKVHTDGGCLPNPGSGGWAAVIIYNKNLHIINGRKEETTNNQMELTAVIQSLHFIKNNFPNQQKIKIYIDSQYVKYGITTWIYQWKRNKWKNFAGAPIKNKGLWEELYFLCNRKDISWKWVKGHSGNVFNELCDTIIRLQRKK
jgi:ribonuclease HI